MRNPVIAPRCVLVSRGQGIDGILQPGLDVPNGLSRQYFSAVIARANGHTQRTHEATTGSHCPSQETMPRSSSACCFPSLTLPVSRYSSMQFRAIRFRFEPNDFGKVDFRAECSKS